MSMVWRILYWIDHLNQAEGLGLGLSGIGSVYNLQTFDSSHIIFKIKARNHYLVLNTSYHKVGWQRKYFYVNRKSLENGDSFPVD